MNCTYHYENEVLLICLAPHKCQCQRKLCIECLYEHEVQKKQTVPIKIFQEMVMKKYHEYQPPQTTELITQRMKFKSMLISTQNMLKKILDEFAESLQQIYDLMEMEDKYYSKFINNMVNPIELSNTELDKLVQTIIGNTQDDWNDLKKSNLTRLLTKTSLNEQTKGFCEKLNQVVKDIMQFINNAANSDNLEENIQPIKDIDYIKKEDLFSVLTQTKNIYSTSLNELIIILKKEKITNCLEFFSKKYKEQTQLKFIANLIQNISEIDFNKRNYSTENFEQIRKDLIKKISFDQHIIEFLKFLVLLTAIDERFIQCGSNSLNLLVEMQVDLNESSFENIRIRDTSLVGGNFVRCNFSESEFDNVDISGINLNQAKLFNCKWKNIKIHELNKLDGHESGVNAVCFSPDGTTLASCSGNSPFLINLEESKDNSIRLWDVKTGKQKAKLDGHSSTVTSINFSLDGTSLASGSNDNPICLWDVKTGQQILTLENRYKDILAQFTPSPIENNVLSESTTSNITAQQISQNPNLEAEGALILKGELVNYQGVDLKLLLKSKGA